MPIGQKVALFLLIYVLTVSVASEIDRRFK